MFKKLQAIFKFFPILSIKKSIAIRCQEQRQAVPEQAPPARTDLFH